MSGRIFTTGPRARLAYATGPRAGLAYLIAAVAAAVSAFAPSAAFAGAGEYAPIIGAGVHFYSGVTGESATGQMGYFLDFQSEQRKGVIRPSIMAEISMASGNASIGEDLIPFTMYGAGFLAGTNIFLFKGGRFAPFVGGFGIASWNLLKLTGQPDDVEPNTQSLGFGYELSAGVDMRFGAAEGNALRIQGSYWSTSATLGGVGFGLTGFRLQLGIVY